MFKIAVYGLAFSLSLQCISANAVYKARSELLERIGPLSSVTELNLQGIRISNKDLNWIIQHCPEITSLDLSHQNSIITNRAKDLVLLKNLCFLNLKGTSLPLALDQFLKERNPNLMIQRSESSLFGDLTQQEIDSHVHSTSSASVSLGHTEFLKAQGCDTVSHSNDVFSLKQELAAFLYKNPMDLINLETLLS